MKKLATAVFALVWTFAPLAYANGDHGKKGHEGHSSAAPDSSAQAGAMAEGEVRRVDKEAKKLTIRHGPLVEFDMPAMTMVFQVDDPAMLDAVKVGDKVKFRAEKVGGAFKVVKIEPAH